MKTFTVSINVCVAKNNSMHRASSQVWKPSVACWPTVPNVSFPSLIFKKRSAGGRQNMPHPCKLTFDLLTLKVVYESRVTCATSVPILVFLGLSVID